MMVRGLHSGSSSFARSMFSSPLCKCGIKLLFALLTLALGFFFPDQVFALLLFFFNVSSAWSCEFVQAFRLTSGDAYLTLGWYQKLTWFFIFLNKLLTASSISILYAWCYAPLIPGDKYLILKISCFAWNTLPVEFKFFFLGSSAFIVQNYC